MEMELIKNENSVISFSQVNESFIDYLDVDDKTLHAYKAGIKSFLNYLKEKGITKPTRSDVRAYRDELKETKSVYTVNTYLTSLKALFGYLSDKGLYEDITYRVKNLQVSYSHNATVFSTDEVKKIYSSLTDYREKALFGLAVTTGLRANEIANAKIENIKIHNGEVVLYVKCKKRDNEDEYVKLSDKVLNDIKKYIENRTSGYIFISRSRENYGEGVTNKTIRVIVKKILKRNGIDENGISCHTLRRSMATIAYENGEDLLSIQRVLHHSSTSVTERYIQQTIRNNNKLEYKVSNVIFGE